MGLVCITTVYNISGHNFIPASVASLFVAFGLCWPSMIARIPQIFWKAYAVAIIPLVLINVFAKETIPALLDLNTWLILFRCLNHSKRREEMQLALLCLFLIIMTGILTATLVFGIQLLLFSAIAIAYLVVGSALESKIEGDYTRLAKVQIKSTATVGRAVLSVMNTRFAMLSVAIFASLICIACGVFLVIPRIDVEDKISLFNMRSTQTLSGFSDRVQLGEVTNIKNDDRIALRVDVDENAIVPVTPYWRMLALDDYENGAFSLSQRLLDQQKSPLASPYHSIRYWPDKRFAQVPSTDQRDKWTFFLEPEVSRYLPVSGSFKQMTIGDLNSISIGPQMHSFSMKENSSKMISYQIEGVDLSGRFPDVPANLYASILVQRLDEEVDRNRPKYPKTLLTLPAEPRAAALFRKAAQEITGGKALPANEFARRVNEHLWENHKYSMSVSLPLVTDVSDPVARWYRSDLPGHCEFFASTFVMIARAAGYKARVAVGFKGGAWNPYENYFMVRNSDAHAWVEIYDGSKYWIRVDPTPGSDRPDIAPATQLVANKIGESDSQAFLDSLRVIWYRRIVNFDEAAQKEAAIQLKDFFLAYVHVAKTWAVNTVKYVYLWLVGPWSIWRILYMWTLAGILVAAFLIQRNMALNFRELLASMFWRGDPIRRKASKVLRKFQNGRHDTSEALALVIGDLQRLRFGAKETWPNPRLVFKAARRIR